MSEDDKPHRTLPDRVPGLDVAGALAMMRDNDVLLIKLLGDFRARYMQTPDIVRAMIDRGELEEARRATHSLKGVSGNIRAERTFAAAKALEAGLRDAGDGGPAVDDRLAELSDALGELDGGLAMLLGDDA